MKSYNISKNYLILKDEDTNKYYVSHLNQHTGAITTRELEFDKEGIAEVKEGQSITIYKKDIIDMSLVAQNLF